MVGGALSVLTCSSVLRGFCREKCTVLCMSDTLPITEARARFGSLVRRAGHARERITITDHGQPIAVLINPQELADLEDALALAQYRIRQAAGLAELVPQDEVRSRLGLEG
jgi:prevent-host-death family protein